MPGVWAIAWKLGAVQGVRDPQPAGLTGAFPKVLVAPPKVHGAPEPQPGGLGAGLPDVHDPLMQIGKFEDGLPDVQGPPVQVGVPGEVMPGEATPGDTMPGVHGVVPQPDVSEMLPWTSWHVPHCVSANRLVSSSITMIFGGGLIAVGGS